MECIQHEEFSAHCNLNFSYPVVIIKHNCNYVTYELTQNRNTVLIYIYIMQNRHTHTHTEYARLICRAINFKLYFTSFGFLLLSHSAISSGDSTLLSLINKLYQILQRKCIISRVSLFKNNTEIEDK
jgi:hypothetical protein